MQADVNIHQNSDGIIFQSPLRDKGWTKKRIRILLLQPPFGPLKFSPDWVEQESFSIPLGLLYLAAPLLSRGHQVTFIDMNLEGLDLSSFDLLVEQSDVVGISSMDLTLANTEILIEMMRQMPNCPKIICGGAYCTMARKHIRGADVCVSGYADDFIVNIIEKLVLRESLVGIPGLSFMTKTGIETTQGVLECTKLDAISPALELVPSKYKYGTFAGIFFGKLAGMYTTRGCVYRCNFCTHHQFFKYREQSAKKVVQDLVRYSQEGYEFIVFNDENFSYDQARAYQILDGIINERLNFKIVLQARADSVSPPLLKKMKKAGVILVMYGIESANQDVLDFYAKGTSVEQNQKAIQWTNAEGMLSLAFLLIGAPFETRLYFDRNVQFVNNAKADFVIINVLIYAKGSFLWKQLVEDSDFRDEQVYIPANRLTCSFTTEELINIKRKMLGRIWSDPRRIFRAAVKILRFGKGLNVLKAVLANGHDFIGRLQAPFLHRSPAKCHKNISRDSHH